MKDDLMDTWVCEVCGFRYEEQSEKTPFPQLPDDWKCPICSAPKDAFQKV